MPDELWTEVRDIVQETRIETIPKKNKCKTAKWLSEESFKAKFARYSRCFLTSYFCFEAVKRRKDKSKGEKERYTRLNAEFQGIARRDKKSFLSDHCKEIEENNRMGNTRDLFKKIKDTKETFHEKWAK